MVIDFRTIEHVYCHGEEIQEVWFRGGLFWKKGSYTILHMAVEDLVYTNNKDRCFIVFDPGEMYNNSSVEDSKYILFRLVHNGKAYDLIESQYIEGVFEEYYKSYPIYEVKLNGKTPLTIEFEPGDQIIIHAE